MIVDTSNQTNSNRSSLFDSNVSRARQLEKQAVFDAEQFIQNRKNAFLVNTANTPSVSEKSMKTTGKSHRKTKRKYQLRAHARRLLTDANVMSNRINKKTGLRNKHRTRTCGFHRNAGDDGITVDLNADALNSEATISGTQSCTCIWGCPVCYEKKAMEAAEKILTTIEWAKANNHFCLMVALTASHSREMSLDFSKSTFKDAWTTFNAHYSWKKFKKSCISHVIHNVDITHGIANGWHYHKHLLLVIDRDKIEPEQAQKQADSIITKYWLHSLDLNDGEASEEHGAHVSDYKKSPSDYMAKIGITVQDDGKLHYEMTSSENKHSRTIWDILSHSRHGDKHATYLYLEYVKSMTGDNWMSFGSTGLQDIIENFELSEGDNEQPKEKKHWLSFSDYWWDIVKWSHDGDVRIIEVAAKTRSIDSIRELLEAMRCELMEANKLSEYYCKFIPIENSIADVRIHEDWKETIQNGDIEGCSDSCDNTESSSFDKPTGYSPKAISRTFDW